MLRAALTARWITTGPGSGELNRQIDLELPRELTIDLEGVTFMDSSGIAVLLRAWRRVGELGGSVQVVNVPAQAAKVLKTAGLDKLMKFA